MSTILGGEADQRVGIVSRVSLVPLGLKTSKVPIKNKKNKNKSKSTNNIKSTISTKSTNRRSSWAQYYEGKQIRE